MNGIDRLVARVVVFAAVVLLLVGVFLATTLPSSLRLPEDVKRRVAVTPATTVGRFPLHFVANLFHENLAHIAFNLLVFTAGFWLATRRADPAATVGTSYALGIFTVFLLQIALVIPLARLGLPYAVEALHRPLVGFSVIAYATLGAGITVLPPAGQWSILGGVLVFEVAAAAFVTAPFISVYHLGGLAMGYYVRRLLESPPA